MVAAKSCARDKVRVASGYGNRVAILCQAPPGIERLAKDIRAMPGIDRLEP